MARGEINWNRRERDLWRRPTKEADRREAEQLVLEILMGMPGSGKSEVARHGIVAGAQAHQEAIVVFDPHGTLADDALADLIFRGFEPRIEVLDLNYTRRVCGFDLMPYSTADFIGDRRQQDDAAIERVGQILSRTRPDAMSGPIRGTWTRNALRLRQRQRKQESLRLAPYGLLTAHPIATYLLKNCTDEKLAFEFLAHHGIKNAFQREAIFGPAKRLMEPFFGNAFVDAMLSAPWVNLTDWLMQKKIIIVRSDPDVDPATTAAVMGMVFQLIYMECGRYRAKTNRPLHTRIIFDEFLRINPSIVEVNLFEQGRKWGPRPTLIVQKLDPTSEHMAFLNCCSRLEVFAMGSEAGAELAARQIGTLLFDSKKAKDIQYRDRNVTRGQHRDVIKTTAKRKDAKGKSDGEIINEHILTTPDQDVVTDTVISFEPLQEQLADVKRDIMGQDVGYRIVVERGRTTGKSQYVQQLVTSWASESAKQDHVAMALERIRSRSHYHTPDFLPPSVPHAPEAEPKKPPTRRGGKGMRPSSNS